MTFKKTLISKYLKPKKRLRCERRMRDITLEECAKIAGLERRQYALKENGIYPFKDYEMEVLSKFFKISIEELFF